MFKNILSKIKSLSDISIPRSTKILLYLIFASLSILGSLVYSLRTWPFTWEYLKFNPVQLSIILLVSFILYYNSYRRFTKKIPQGLPLIAFILMYVVFALSLFALNLVLAQVLRKAIFSQADYIYSNIALIISMLIMANFDMPLTHSLTSFYINVRENMYRNLGLLLFLMFVVAYLGLMNRSFTYIIAAITLLAHTYLFKAFLSNLRN